MAAQLIDKMIDNSLPGLVRVTLVMQNDYGSAVALIPYDSHSEALAKMDTHEARALELADLMGKAQVELVKPKHNAVRVDRGIKIRPVERRAVMEWSDWRKDVPHVRLIVEDEMEDTTDQEADADLIHIRRIRKCPRGCQLNEEVDVEQGVGEIMSDLRNRHDKKVTEALANRMLKQKFKKVK